MIQQFNNRLKVETQKLDVELNLINEDSSTYKKESLEFDEKKKAIKNITKENLDIFLNNNNKIIFGKIKFIIRNLIMAIIWAIVFYKLSVI